MGLVQSRSIQTRIGVTMAHHVIWYYAEKFGYKSAEHKAAIAAYLV